MTSGLLHRPPPGKVSHYRSVFLLLTVLLAALSQSGCGLITSGNGTLVVSATNLNFGNVAIGSSINQSLTLTNSGNNSITLTQIASSGRGFRLELPALP